MKEITNEEISKINHYFINEISKIDPEIEVIIHSAPETIKGLEVPKLVLPAIVKEKIKQQVAGKDYTYVLTNDQILERNIKIIMSNSQHHIVLDTYQGIRLTYLDSNFKEIGNSSYENVTGENFDSIQGLQFKFILSTPYCKTVKIDVCETDANYFYVSSMGKNRIKTVYFNYDKKQIDVEFSNSFIKEINLDLEGNLKHICMKRNISRELTLKKYHFDVDSYSSFMKLIEEQLDLHNLKSDGDIDFMDSKSFEERIDFIKNIINEKHSMDNKTIYNYIDNINNVFKMLTKQLTDNSVFVKEHVDDRNYYYPQLVINYLLRMKKHNFSFNSIVTPEVLDSYNYLIKLSKNIKNTFEKKIVKNIKQIKRFD